jgi:hypothetical protein
MILTAAEVHRSFKGALSLLNRRPEGLRAFDMSERGFWRSFGAIALTLPAFVIALTVERWRLGLLQPDRSLLDSPWLDVVVSLGHMAKFLAFPALMILAARKFSFGARCIPFIIVTNWITALLLTVLSVPALLLVIGWATPELAALYTFAFAIVMARLQWFATTLTLGVSGDTALAVTGLGLVLQGVIGALMRLMSG